MPKDYLQEQSPDNMEDNMIEPRDFLREELPRENIGISIAKALPRIGEDIYRHGYDLISHLPEYAETAYQDIPLAFNEIRNNPRNSLKQFLAGITESGQNVFNFPHDVSNYFTNRLHLIPENINTKIQMGRMPESENEINATFGVPGNRGEEALRFSGRNLVNAMSLPTIVNPVNPLNLTSKNIARNILDTEKKNVISHNRMYDKIWRNAKKTGFDNVPFNRNILNVESSFIDKFYPEKSTKALRSFISSPTLENAQKAQSDLGNLRRSLEEKSRTTPLLETEKMLHGSLSNAEKHIEQGMFRNSAGNINKRLKKQYDKVTRSYRENVVPYKYNKSIQAFKNREILPEELVNSLSRGEFAAKKGNFLTHPALYSRNSIVPVIKNLGYVGGAGWILNNLYNNMFGNGSTRNQ